MNVALIHGGELSCSDLRSDFDEVCTSFRAALINLGFAEGVARIATFEACRIEVVVDGYDHQECILGDWFDEKGTRFAHIVRYDSGNLFAEHDVLLPHPTRPEWFVEAIEIWGDAGKLKSEARLLPGL